MEAYSQAYCQVTPIVRYPDRSLLDREQKTYQLRLRLIIEDRDLQGKLFASNNRVWKVQRHEERLEHLHLKVRKK